MHDRALAEPRAYPIGEQPGKTTSRFDKPEPVYLGTTLVGGRLVHAFRDGTLLRVVAGGAIDAATELPTLMTVGQFARECNIAKSTAWAIVSRGEIETVVVGERSRRIPRDAFLAYIESLRNTEKAS